MISKQKNKNRFQEIDLLRGLAVMGMIIFHFFFILNFFAIYTFDIFAPSWIVFGRIVQILFLSLVGISLPISQKKYPQQILRATKILIGGLIITATTYYFIPEIYIRFGILHFIAISILLLGPLAKYKYLPLAIALIALLLTSQIHHITSDNLFLIILGANPSSFASIDHFAIFPWLSVVAFGIFLGHTLKFGKARIRYIAPLTFLGRHSLTIYLLHVPLIILLLIALQIIPLSLFLPSP